jgi:sugar transferase (PEP-CTERM/EpsH1 system associated)
MKILFLTPQIPYPPQKGTSMRNWGLISGLAERHRVSVLSFLDPGQSPVLDDKLTATCRIEVVEPPVRTLHDRLRDMVVTSKPDMALRLASDAYAERLADLMGEEDLNIVHVEGIEMAPYISTIRTAGSSAWLVFDDHNCEYLLQKRAFVTDLRIPRRWPAAAYSFVQWLRLRRYEAQACRRADRVIAVSEADAAALHRLVPGVQVTVAPNGIDTRAYRPEVTNHKSQISKNGLVFTGTMDFRPNVDAVLWFAREVLPRVRAQVPDVHFCAVGQRPHRRLSVLGTDPTVTMTGFVEDTRPYITDAAVYVVPLRMGGGTRFKILEAMAMGKPVVSTRLGAEGFPVAHGQELLLADEPEEFADAVVSLLRSPERREALGWAGRAFVEARYDWRAIVPLVEAAYESPNL